MSLHRDSCPASPLGPLGGSCNCLTECKVCCQKFPAGDVRKDGACQHCWEVFGDKWLS